MLLQPWLREQEVDIISREEIRSVDIFTLTESSVGERMMWLAECLTGDAVAGRAVATDLENIDSHYADGSCEHPVELLARLSSNNHQQSLITEQKIIRALCSEYQLDYGSDNCDNLEPVDPDPDIAFMRHWCIYLAGISHGELVIVASEPYSHRLWRPLLECVYAMPVHLCLQEPRYIKEQIDKIGSTGDQSQGQTLRLDDVVLDLTRVLNMAGEQEEGVEQLHGWLLGNAFRLFASDIHLETRRSDVRVRLRIDGVLSDYNTLPKSTGMLLINRIKVLSGLDITEARMPQDGRMTVNKDFGVQEIRVSSMPLITGEKLVLRIFDPDLLYQPLNQIFARQDQYQLWMHLVAGNQGLILVTGPTGSGKTTTLYSTLSYLHSPRVNICTVENPVEMVDQRFNQVQVNNQIDMSFVRALRNLLRQDPDIIMIGEIRDQETATVAIQAALTGHLVLATLHTNDALSAVYRMLDLGIPDFLLRATLRGVLAQRLVRLLCPQCQGQKGSSDCVTCRRTGYKGRRAIFELVAINDHIRPSLSKTANDQLLARVREAGYGSLLQSGEALVNQGLTDNAEIYRVCPVDDANARE